MGKPARVPRGDGSCGEGKEGPPILPLPTWVVTAPRPRARRPGRLPSAGCLAAGSTSRFAKTCHGRRSFSAPARVPAPASASGAWAATQPAPRPPGSATAVPSPGTAALPRKAAKPVVLPSPSEAVPAEAGVGAPALAGSRAPLACFWRTPDGLARAGRGDANWTAARRCGGKRARACGAPGAGGRGGRAGPGRAAGAAGAAGSRAGGTAGGPQRPAPRPSAASPGAVRGAEAERSSPRLGLRSWRDCAAAAGGAEGQLRAPAAASPPLPGADSIFSAGSPLPATQTPWWNPKGSLPIGGLRGGAAPSPRSPPPSPPLHRPLASLLSRCTRAKSHPLRSGVSALGGGGGGEGLRFRHFVIRDRYSGCIHSVFMLHSFIPEGVLR